MRQNMGSLDKAVRVLAAVIISVLYFTNVISGVVAVIMLMIAGIFLLTSLVSFCPLYFPFGISTRKRAQ